MFSYVGRWLLAGGAAAILVVGVAGWLRDDGTRLSELAPNFLSAAVLLILSWFLQSRQRS